MYLRLERSGNGTHHATLPPDCAQSWLADGQQRVVCTLNDSISFHAAIMPRKDGSHFIHIGKAHCKALGLTAGDLVLVVLTKDETSYQFDMPEALQAVLDSDPGADRIFHSFTPGNQLGLIYG
ncbi:MAG: hypothetical protein OHK0039_16460 [Bacteroidia bacterium]